LSLAILCGNSVRQFYSAIEFWQLSLAIQFEFGISVWQFILVVLFGNSSQQFSSTFRQFSLAIQFCISVRQLSLVIQFGNSVRQFSLAIHVGNSVWQNEFNLSLAKRIQFDNSAIRLSLAKQIQFDISAIGFGDSVWHFGSAIYSGNSDF
jgi:hypothetical protein